MRNIEKYYKKEVLILGFGITGLSVVSLLKKAQCNIYIWDDNFEKLNKKNIKGVNAYNAENKKIDDFNFIFVSPGIEKNHFLLTKARKKNITITNDIELYWELKELEKKKSTLIGITGTNGKSTIALMISNVLKTKPLGNYGNPILKFITKKDSKQVIELSSFQLDYINKFKPKISIISNIDKDHLLHHKTFKKYLDAKMNIIKNQTKEDYLLVNYDDKNIKKYLERKENIKPLIIYISNKLILKKGVSILKNKLIDNFFNHKEYVIQENSFLNLSHNKLNLAFSFIALSLLEKKPDYILNELSKFKGLAHRLEFIGTVNNIKFFNDSKATNVSATCSALEAFDKVILIAGGSSKGDSFQPLRKYSNVVHETYLYGETALEIAKSLKSACKSYICEGLYEAVKRSYTKSIKEGRKYPILFSPACASFDQYKNFAKRGEHFKNIFKEILRDVA